MTDQDQTRMRFALETLARKYEHLHDKARDAFSFCDSEERNERHRERSWAYLTAAEDIRRILENFPA